MLKILETLRKMVSILQKKTKNKKNQEAEGSLDTLESTEGFIYSCTNDASPGVLYTGVDGPSDPWADREDFKGPRSDLENNKSTGVWGKFSETLDRNRVCP